MAERQSLADRLRSQLVCIGSWVTLAHPAIAEIMARAGFEWLAIDLEHSVITIREAEELIRVIELCGVSPLVRLSWNDPIQIKRVMDAGAHGVIVPMVNTADEARRAVEAVKYPPRGRRGVGLARAQGYGASFERYHQWVERESVVIVQIEHIRAVENLRSILEVPGVDGFMVGPYDISGSLGLPGEFEHPKFKEAIKTISAVASAVDAMAGYHVVYPRLDEVEQKIVEGYRFIAYSTDALFLGESCRQGLNSIRTLQEKIKTAAPV